MKIALPTFHWSKYYKLPRKPKKLKKTWLADHIKREYKQTAKDMCAYLDKLLA